MQKIKKYITGFLITLTLCLPFFSFNTINLTAATLHNIDIDVALQADGTAQITQVWHISVSEGTELYLPQENLGDIELSNFHVYEDADNPYIYEDDWNVHASREQKANKFGMVKTARGYELCWGIGEYGSHTYTLQYTMTNFVKAFTDYDGFNQRLLNDKMQPTPQAVTIRIYAPDNDFTTETTKVWAFGFQGTIFVEDGKIIAKTTSAISSNNYMNILVRFDKNIFTPTNKQATSFQKLQDKAMEDSDYDTQGQPTIIMFLLVFVGITLFLLALVIFVVFITQKSGFVVNKYQTLKAPDYFREIPFDSNLVATSAALRYANAPVRDGDIIGAYLLRWINNKNIELKETEVKRFLFLTGVEATVTFIKMPDITGDSVEYELYQILQQAAGKDGILQEKEFKKWVEKHYEQIQRWQKEYREDGDILLGTKGMLETVTQKFLNLFPIKRSQLTALGTSEAIRALGLKKYLIDYSLIAERNPNEVAMWDDYLVYAALFGIADQVAKTFKELYPQEFIQYEHTHNMNTYASLRIIHSLSHSYTSGISAASSGGGGFSSSGGGGGFSGGGSGGGVR